MLKETSMADKKIICTQCNETFLLTANEMDRIMAKGFGLPKRCPECRKKKNKMNQPAEDYGRSRGRRRNHRRPRYDEFDDNAY
jgi:hypothetical protein